MPVEAKPIFRPDAIRLPILGFSLPEQVVQRRTKLEKWAEIIATGSVDAHKEQEILGDFINDVFCELLGYTRAVDNPSRYTISREKHVQANGKFADAVLGEFGPEGKRYVAAVEGKGPKDPLDRPFAGRKVSAVDQAFDYAINLRCNWILVTNIRQTRLYYKGTDKQTFERFDTDVLAQDDKHLRKFVFLLHASRMVPLHGPSHLDSLFQESEKVGSELTLEFYAHYDFARRSACPACAGRIRTSSHALSWGAPRSSWTGSSSSPFARIAAFCPPRPSSEPSGTEILTTRVPSGTTSAGCSGRSTSATKT